MPPDPPSSSSRTEDAERRLRALAEAIEHINQGISYFGPDLRLELCNQRYLRLLDFPSEFGIPGTPFETFIRYNAERGDYGPGDPEVQVAERVAMARQAKAHRFERTRPDGTTLEINGVPLDNGGFVTTYADITERKRHEQLLETAQQRTELALDSAALGLWDWNLGSDEFAADHRYRDILGIPADLALSRTEIRLRVRPEDREGLQQALTDHLDGGAAQFIHEYRVLHSNQTWIWLQARGRIVSRDAAGKPLRMVGTVQDISERKRQEAMLRERERRLAMLVRSMQDLILVLDTAGTIAECWPAPAVDLGLDPQHAVGRPFTEVLPVEMGEGITAAMVEALMEDSAKRFEFSTAANMASYQVTLTRLADSGKYATGFLVVVRDITELQRLRDELARLSP